MDKCIRWTEVSKLTASDAATDYKQFGISVSISSDGQWITSYSGC